MDDDAQALLRQGNQQTLDQMKAAMPPNDPCSSKHEAAILPFAKRTFELMEMQFNSQRKAPVKLPTPWGVMELDSRDFVRLAGIVLIGFMVWMNLTDKQERQQVIQEIRAYRQAHSAEKVQTTMVK